MDIAGCCGKKVYLTYDHAKHDAAQVERKHSERAQVYRCRACQAWHVGQQVLGPMRKPRRAVPAYDEE